MLLQDGLHRSRTYSERFYGRFERQIKLDRDIDENAVNATFKNGVLTVTVPKSTSAAERSKRIPINAGKTEESRTKCEGAWICGPPRGSTHLPRYRSFSLDLSPRAATARCWRMLR